MPRTDIRYPLAKKYTTCPACRQTCFQAYTDGTTEKALSPDCGKCRRINHCKYHRLPSEIPGLLKQGAFALASETYVPPPPVVTLPPDGIDAYRAGAPRTRLAMYLSDRFGAEAVADVLNAYRCGAHDLRPGAILFPQFALTGELRQAKAMSYHVNGRRDKDGDDRTQSAFIGKTILRNRGLPPDGLRQCFFGEHLLPAHPGAVVCVVESEKTALVMACAERAGTFRIDESRGACWIATGGSSGASWKRPETFAALRDRDVVFFPDRDDAGRKWFADVDEVQRYRIAHTVQAMVWWEDIPTEVEEGADIADLLLSAPEPHTAPQTAPQPQTAPTPPSTPETPSYATPEPIATLLAQAEHPVVDGDEVRLAVGLAAFRFPGAHEQLATRYPALACDLDNETFADAYLEICMRAAERWETRNRSKVLAAFPALSASDLTYIPALQPGIGQTEHPRTAALHTSLLALSAAA